MSNMSKQPEEPFQFPKNLLHQISECSQDSCFLLVYKSDGCLIPVISANPSDAEAICGFTQKYLAALDNVEFQRMMDMFYHLQDEEEEGLAGEEE
jgi:hypothetical protein